MGNYLALIRKADFIDLYKYGSIHVNRDMIRQFSCKIDELPFREPIFDDITFFANSFDSTFTYLFINYKKVEGRENDINIADVQGIYPLDDEAKKELSISLDPRIQIHNPLWPNAVYKLQKSQSVQNCKNGAINIWRIYNISEPIEIIENILTDSIINEVVDELYENRQPSGNLSLWVYVMRYERHAFYPNNTIGAFMDTANVLFNYQNGKEVDSSVIESEMIMQFFQYCNEKEPNMSFTDILHKLSIQTHPDIVGFIDYSRQLMPDVDILKAITLFFIYRNRYQEEFRYEEQWKEAGKNNGIEFAIACYMLGCKLGHEHTYDCLYEQLPLPIFKKKKERTETMTDTLVIDNNTQSVDDKKVASSVGRANNKIIQSSLFNNQTLLPVSIIMKKSPRARTTIIVKTQEDYNLFLQKGYIEVAPKEKKNKKK